MRYSKWYVYLIVKANIIMVSRGINAHLSFPTKVFILFF